MKVSDSSEVFREEQELFYTGHKKTPTPPQKKNPTH